MNEENYERYRQLVINADFEAVMSQFPVRSWRTTTIETMLFWHREIEELERSRKDYALLEERMKNYERQALNQALEALEEIQDDHSPTYEESNDAYWRLKDKARQHLQSIKGEGGPDAKTSTR